MLRKLSKSSLELFGFVIFFTFAILLFLYGNEHKDNEGFFTKNKGKNVLFDLGAGTGDSVYNFFGLIANTQDGSFPRSIPRRKIKEKWIVYAIERDQSFNYKLSKMKKKISSLGHKIILMNGTMASIHDGYRSFLMGKSIRPVTQLRSSLQIPLKNEKIEKKKIEKRKCVNVARLLKQFNKNDFIVLRMDIDGYEYEMLLHFIKENVLHLIDYIHVEYHLIKLSPYKTFNQFFSQLFRATNMSEFQMVRNFY
jgi:hypothetical protein